MNFSRFNRGGMFDMMRRDGPGPSSENNESSGVTGQNEGGGLRGGAAPPILTRPRAPALLPLKRDLVEETAISPAPGPGPSPGLGPGSGAQDSITLGQLKAHTAAMEKKQKTQQYDFRYDDTDTLMNELQEFYPYVEMSHVAKNPEKFKGSFDGEWTEAPLHKRRAYVEIQLEQLESPVHDTRRAAQGRLLYLLQGCFAETTSPEMQLHWVIENAKAIRAVDGVATIVIGLRDASRRYTASATDDKPSSSAAGTVPAASAVDPYDDRSAELMDLLGMLYFIVEVFRTDDSFGDELMAMSPPLPLVIFQMIAGLKDRLPKGYPVKKVLLLMWKTLLACLGGMKEASKARVLSWELAGLRPEEKYFTKATPIDISSWRKDTSTKYPTFAPSSSNVISVPNEKLAEGIKPIPARPNYHSTEIPLAPIRPQTQSNGSALTSNPLPGTPAPSPPPSPVVKPKKQQYQTDPTRPFVFPYSRSNAGGPSNLVPFAIAEADNLYHRHAYVSLGLYQLWEAREECMREERGLGRSGLIGFSSTKWDDDEDEEAEEAMRRDWKYEEEEMDCTARGDKEGARIAKEKRAAARRLHRVEIIYKNTLPILQSCIIVLLKLLLATVTSPGTNAVNLSVPPVQSPTQEVPPTETAPLTREEVDIARHREITSKAVSAILILLLKWFKASHILKFNYLAQLLFDSNCALLVLKMFGLTDLVNVVTVKHEIEDLNFFRYCQLNCSKSPENNRPEDSMFRAQASNTKTSPRASLSTLDPPPTTTIDGAEIELISDYSWRNFFSTINFLKILQKITKHRTHRTYMMTTYKSSQILKRMLRVNHPMLQLQVLKLIKSQMPWCGRKWRQSNMKVITSIYLNCRPELRDDWLAGTDQDTELEDALPQEYALRSLIQFYNKRHYSAHMGPLPSPDASQVQAHRRSNSTSAVILEDPALHNHNHTHGQGQGLHPRSGSTGESDVFPPRKSRVPELGLPYNPDGMIEFWLHEYEDVLGEVFGEDIGGGHDHVWDEFGLGLQSTSSSSSISPSAAGVGGGVGGGIGEGRDDRAWSRLNEIMRNANGGGGGTEEDISDSESVVSVGQLGPESRFEIHDEDITDEREQIQEQEQGDDDEIKGVGPRATAARRLSLGHGRRKSGDGENTWEHMSPTLALLPKSPMDSASLDRRRRSSGSGSGCGPRSNSPYGLGRRASSPRKALMDLQDLSHSLSLSLQNSNGEVFHEEDEDIEQQEEMEMESVPGPMPIRGDTKDLEEREGGAVDEVEYTYGE